MNKICTSIEQSLKIIELGIDVNTADMFYTIIDQGLYLEVKQGIEPSKDDIPAWSLTALLDVLPKGTRLLKSTTDDTYHCDCPKENIDKWFDNSVDACYEMILKLHELKKL